MIIGIDLHGVADTYPEIKGLLEAIRSGGNQVYVISGPHVDKIVARLEALEFKHKVHYDEILSVVHFLKYYNYEMWQDEKGDWWTSDEDWWSSKAKICLEYNIDIMIDDSERYREWFEKLNVPTKFVLFKKELKDETAS